MRDSHSLSVWATRLLDAGAELNRDSSRMRYWLEYGLAVFFLAESSEFLHGKFLN